MTSPASDHKDKYSHITGKAAAKDATGHMLQANKTYGCEPTANKRDTCSIKEATQEMQGRVRKRAGKSCHLPPRHPSSLGYGGGQGETRRLLLEPILRPHVRTNS